MAGGAVGGAVFSGTSVLGAVAMGSAALAPETFGLSIVVGAGIGALFGLARATTLLVGVCIEDGRD